LPTDKTARDWVAKYLACSGNMTPFDFSLLTPPPEGEQNTQGWLDARRGRITASSRAHKLITGRDSTLSLMMDEMAEELKHPASDGFSNRYTEHGHAFEGQAIGDYDMMRLSFDPIIVNPGMFVHSEFDIASATPDFLEGDDISGQVKCPYMAKNHLNLLHFGCRMVSDKYYTQVQFEAFVTARKRIVFVSYHPDVPATNQLYHEEVPLDNEMQDKFYRKLTEINHMLVNDERFEEKKNTVGIDGIPDLW